MQDSRHHTISVSYTHLDVYKRQPEEFIVEAVSDSQSYRQFGNSVSMPVIRAIAKRMMEKAGSRLMTQQFREVG